MADCYYGIMAGDLRVLPSIANEVLKSVVAQYNAIELIGKREQVVCICIGRVKECGQKRRIDIESDGQNKSPTETERDRENNRPTTFAGLAGGGVDCRGK